MSEQREYCKRFPAVYRLRLSQNISRKIAWNLAATTAGREVSPSDAEREEAEAWLREKVKTVWPR